jgi:hypothetical protein
MHSNTILKTILIALVVAHTGGLIGIYGSPRGLKFLLTLNATCAAVILLYTVSRASYLIAAKDWLMVGLFVVEGAVLAAALAAFRNHPIATIASYVAFGLHAFACLGATVFAFTFKLTKLM